MTLTGQNGILTKANEAREKTEIAEVIEKIKLDVEGRITENQGKLATEELKKVIANYDKDGEIKNDEKGVEYIETIKGHKILVSDIWNEENNIDNVEVAPKIGDYVEYNMSYKDMYTDYEFATNNGWRILDTGIKNTDGTYSNIKLISTGIPVKLYYSPSINIGNTNNGWWATDSQIEEMYGTDYSTGYNNYPNRYAEVGLLKNFESIPFSQGTIANANQGIYSKINTTEIGNIYGSIFKTEKASEVHALTLRELNISRGLSSDDKTPVSTNDGDTGLFYLRNLVNENTQYGYTTTTTTACWLGTAYILNNNTETMHCNGSTGAIVSYISDIPLGLRIVITLNTTIQKVSDGYWKCL